MGTRMLLPALTRLVSRSACITVTLLCVLSGAHGADANAPYAVPASEIPGAPGVLLRVEPVAAPAGAASAYRILYRSRGVENDPVVVSGVVAIPYGGYPRTGRGIVSWGHETTGIAPDCAPSRWPAQDFAAIEGLRDLLADGDVVVATDYQGLGAGNGHPYLVG